MSITPSINEFIFCFSQENKAVHIQELADRITELEVRLPSVRGVFTRSCSVLQKQNIVPLQPPSIV